MFKILDLYIGRTIVNSSAMTLSVLVGLSALIKFIEQLKPVGKGSYTILDALTFVVLSMPRDIELFFPMAVLLGSLMGLGMLASSSELTVMQASGYSKLDVGLSVLKTAFPLMIIVMLLGEYGAPQAQKMARELRAFAISGGKITSDRNGVWAKDGRDFIFITRVNGEELTGVNIWQFDDDKQLESTIFATKATYADDGFWLLKEATVTTMSNEVEITKQQLPSYSWQTTLAPDKLAVVMVTPEELALSGLYGYVTYLKNSEQDASRYELALWRKVTQPLSIAVMMLMALSFIFGPLRSVTMGVRVLSGVVSGFAFYISSEFFGPLSLVYSVPPIVGALAPSVVFFGIALYMLNRKL